MTCYLEIDKIEKIIKNKLDFGIEDFKKYSLQIFCCRASVVVVLTHIMVVFLKNGLLSHLKR